MTFEDDPSKQVYLTLDYNTFNFPLDMEYVYDVTSIVPTSSMTELEILTLRDLYNDCREDLYEQIEDEQELIKDLMLLSGEMQDYCSKSY